jgi:hypothetical protein
MKITSFTTLAGLALASPLFAQGFLTSEPSYLLARPNSNFDFAPIVTVGDMVPLTGGASTAQFALAGIPDAMGLYKDRVTGQNVLFVAHETNSATDTTPVVGQTAFKGAFVSRFVLDATGGVISAAPAHKDLYLENTLQANRPPQAGDATAFTRFCAGSFAGPAQGMDRPLFFANEESGTGNYDAAGSQSVVVVDGAMHTLPDLGRIARETTLVQPRRYNITAIISSEDGGAPSFLYMYVGTKQRRSASALDKNGLTGGKNYVLCSTGTQKNEGTFTSGTIPMEWKEIPNAANLTAVQLAEAADDLGGFGFVRVEDVEFDPAAPTRSLFAATTGGSGPNLLGRLYEINLTPANPVGPASMTVVYNADTIVTPGGTYNGVDGQLLGAGATGSLGTYTGGVIANGVDFPVSIDNIAVSGSFILCCEDRNGPADAVFAKYLRNGGLWSLDRANGYAAKLESTFNYPAISARDGNPGSLYTAGLWESSGVLNSEAIFGPGTFMINIQAHNRTSGGLTTGRVNAPNGTGGVLTAAAFRAAYAEDGQVLIIKPKSIIQ